MDTLSLDSIYSLPIHSRREEILASVDANQVTIITAETGAGKSTQVPQYLAEQGYKKIIITQPRILAARNLCNRVRLEYSWRRGKDSSALVGYRTAHEQDDAPDNVILYCTDGLQLVRELTGSGTHDKQVLVLDEIHEWNENMEVLLAWAKKRCQEEPHFKIVLMSATIEADSLATYFGSQAPITVSGRSYAVEYQQSKDLLVSLGQQIMRPGANILVFLPGKAEIEQVADAIRLQGTSMPIIPLHSQLELEEQQKAFEHYGSGKIVLSTNIAQTSITIDDIDVVIDSGLERRIEVRSGIEGLFVSEISQADCQQRAGRAGRTKEGVYILAKFDRLPCTPLKNRAMYGVPEILRKHIDRLVLRLASAGIDIETLQFFHTPSNTTIKQAKKTLNTLGALENGTVTEIGHKMERFPVESSYGRMLVESEKYSATVQEKLAMIIAIQEVGGIIKGGPRYTGWRRLTKQNRSDLLAQYDVFLALPTLSLDDHEDMGIITKNVEKATEVNERLCSDLKLEVSTLGPIFRDEEEPLLKCIIAGQLHQLWVLDKNGEAVHLTTRKRREVSSTTVVKHSMMFAGTAFDLEVTTYGGLETLHLVNEITAVNPIWLGELAPISFKVQSGKVYYDPYFGTLARRMQVTHQGQVVETNGIPVLEQTPSNQKQFVTMFSSWVYQQLEKERFALQGVHFKRVSTVPLKRIEEKVRRLASGAISSAELPKKDRIELMKLIKLETWYGEEFIRGRGGMGHAHKDKADHQFRNHGWQPRHKRKDDRRRRYED